MTNSTNRRRSRKAKTDKPKKPYKDFPLTPHPLGYWCKTINGKLLYFGRWGRQKNGKLVGIEGDGWKEALDLFLAQKDDLYAGRTPSTTDDGDLMVKDLCNHFLTAKQHLLDTGEIVARTFADYKKTTDRLVTYFGGRRAVSGLTPSDFTKLRKHLSQNVGPVRLTGDIGMVKMVFRFGYETGLIDKPIKFGPDFKPPTKHVIRKHRAKKGEKMFEPDELHALLDAASVQLRAMMLLGVNGGFGNSDCGSLPIDAVNLETGWIDFPRPKTGIKRRVPLWPETIAAIRDVLDERPEPKTEAAENLVFVTKYGGSWAKDTSANPISAQFRKLCQSVSDPRNAELVLYRKGVGFYALRHVFETIGGDSRDQAATNAVMGHADGTMAGVYRERISDDRLRAITDHVRSWLFGIDAAGDDPAQNQDAEPMLRVVG